MVKKGYRVESDTLGPVEIPEKALWGPQTQRSKDNFHTGAIPEGTDADDIQVSE